MAPSIRPQPAIAPAPAAANGPRQTLDQRRAAHAWARVEEVCKLDSKRQKKIGTQLKKLPTRIITSGLGPALAFLEAKNKDQIFQPLLDALAGWMNDRRPVPATQTTQLVRRVIHGDAEFLRFATAECLAYLQWLVRFADAKGLTQDAEQEGD